MSDHLERAKLRARGRETLQRMGMTEADLPVGTTLEQVGYIRRPDEWLPAERDEMVALGRKLARKYGW